MAKKEIQLVAHLMRRAGFGASRAEIDSLSDMGYESAVESMFDVANPTSMRLDLIRRHHPDRMGMMGTVGGAHWMYRMISTDKPLSEKVALFWSGIFATGYAKLANGKVLHDQIRMFLRYGLGDFRTLLLELSKDPAMIIWLDNCESHKGAINENYGRELLELFSMGVGNYTEEDIKEASRAFTGWTIANTEYMTLKSMRDSVWPYGRLSMHFEYKKDDHDDGEKVFLGERGHFNGDDIIDIICKQPATANFIARHMYSFFVADEPPVPEWPYKPPRDPEAIKILADTYFESNYSISEMLRVLFKSDFFKSEEVRYERVKSPVELMVGLLRLTQEFESPKEEIVLANNQSMFMGQWLLNPPSVEGWHWGTEWINSGSVVERVNFVSERLGNHDSPGVIAMAERMLANGRGDLEAETLVDRALEQLSMYNLSERSRSAIVGYINEHDRVSVGDSTDDENRRERALLALKMAGVAPDCQRV